MKHLQAYAAGGDAHERGEPGQPPSRASARARGSKGWTDQQAFVARQAAGKPQDRGKQRKAGAK
jgi:hypothetical protein